MNDKRKAEITRLVLKYELRKDGIPLGTNVHSWIGTIAKEIDIATQEADVFIEELMREMLDDAFSTKTTCKNSFVPKKTPSDTK